MAVVFLSAAATSASSTVGVASKIVDGDTLYVCDERVCEKIRLCGIDAPELKAAGGKQARATLASIVANKRVAGTRVSDP